MSQPEGHGQHANPRGTPPAARKPYQKPAVRHERVFETSALTCSKVSTTQYQCHQTSRKAS